MGKPLVSVIINNYNYGHFLAEAINSVFEQTYPRTEIIVVDDGSSDNSREIISSYLNNIIPVFKDNGGQGSAFNAGFEVSTGEIICFLDADDRFLPHKVEEIVRAWQRYPDAVLYYHRMQIIDAQGVIKGRPWPIFLWVGLIRDRVERSGGWWPRPTTSALCFSRPFLERVFPMPEQSFRLCADAYVGDLAPFCGTIVGLPKVLTHYRQHGQNYWGTIVNAKGSGMEKKAKQHFFEHQQLKKALSNLGIKTSITIDRHLPYLITTHALENRPSVWRLVPAILSCPAIGYASRLYRLLNLFLRRF